MKTPLRYQITESDCGTTSFLNAISYVFNREEIPAEIVHSIMTYTLDNVSKQDGESEGGTSIYSLEFLQHWIKQYAEYKHFPIKVKLFEREDATFQITKANKLFKNGGCFMASVWLMKTMHYVIITNADEKFAYIFDPYFTDLKYFSRKRFVKVIKDMPFTHNRKVKLSQLLLNNKEDYSLIKNNEYQELMVIERQNKD